MVEEIIGRLPELTWSQLGRLEDELRHERGDVLPLAGERMLPTTTRALPVTEVLEYSPSEDGYLHRHCCGSDRGDRLFRGTDSRSQKGVRKGVRATLRLVHVAGVRRVKSTEKPHFGCPQGWAACASEFLRTVSEGVFSGDRRCGGVLHGDTQSGQYWLVYKLRGG